MSWLRPNLPPALRSPAYRAYLMGTLASVSGFQMLRFGQFWLMFELTGSPLALGYVGVAQAVPGVVLNLFGGVFADKVDQRRLIMATQSLNACLILFLAVLTQLDLVRVWNLVAMAFLVGAVNAFDEPARHAFYPRLIDRQAMTSAVALNSAVWQSNRIVAPAVAGLIIAWFGTAVSFYLAGLGSLTMVAVIYGLRIARTVRRVRHSPAQDMLEGLSFIKKNSLFSFLIGMTFFNSFFGLAYITLMPVFAVDILEVGADGQGLLMSIGGVGALLATVWFSSRGSTQHKGLLIIGGAVTFGISLIAFALTSEYVGSYTLALVLMFAMGLFNSAYNISVQSSLQMMVPDSMRGRVMGFYTMTYSISPLGAMQAGALATVVTTPIAIAIGGVAVVAFAIGPGMINSKVRNLGASLRLLESSATNGAPNQVQSIGTARD